MSDLISLDAARYQLRAGSETPDERLEELIAAAEQALADHLGRPALVGPGSWADAAAVPQNVVQAAKLVLADLFENRVTPLADLTAVNILAGRYVIVSIG